MRPSHPLTAFAVLLALAGCHKPPIKVTDAERARAVRVIRIEPRPITGSLQASGDLLPREEAAVLPEVSGYRVAAVLADVGQTVRKGQTLARLDGALIQGQLAQQEALAAQAEAQAAQAEDQAARVKDLDNEGVLSNEAISQRRFQAKAARATANAQAAALKDIRTRVGKLAVTAPVAGLVLERTVRPGDQSAAGATPWFRLARDGEIELLAQVSEDDLSKIRPGQSAQVTLPNGRAVTGRVRLISPQIDAQTKLGTVRVRLPVDRDIRAGGFAHAVFADAGGLALTVPESAIRYDADGASVMVVGADNRVRRVLIQTGQRGSGLVQLVKGPAPGAWVVRNAAAFLLDGDMVKPERTPAPAPAPSPPAARTAARR